MEKPTPTGVIASPPHGRRVRTQQYVASGSLSVSSAVIPTNRHCLPIAMGFFMLKRRGSKAPSTVGGAKLPRRSGEQSSPDATLRAATLI